MRAERLLEAIQPRRLAELSAQDVSRYLSEGGRDTSLAAWPFVQIVDAIRILGVVAGARWVKTVDWGHWRASARTLAVDHPTVAWDYGPEVEGLEPAGPMTKLGPVALRVPRLEPASGGGLGLLPVFAGGASDKGYLGVWLVVGRRDAPIRTPAAAWGIADQPMSRAPEILCPLTY